MKPSNESDRGELEPDAPRGARPVLRGRGAGDNTPLPGKKHVDDPLYTTPRFTTTQVAAMLGIKRPTVHSAIQRGTLPSELASVGVRLVSQAAIDAYRVNHLGQVGKPSRKKRRMTQKAAALQAAATPLSNASAVARGTPDADAEKEA